MLRIFEAIKKSPFFNGNYPFRTPSKNASAEIKLTHNLFQNVMPQRMIYHPMIGISTAIISIQNLSVRDSNPQPKGLGGVT